jgi:hypothetical protein
MFDISKEFDSYVFLRHYVPLTFLQEFSILIYFGTDVHYSEAKFHMQIPIISSRSQSYIKV